MEGARGMTWSQHYSLSGQKPLWHGWRGGESVVFTLFTVGGPTPKFENLIGPSNLM